MKLQQYPDNFIESTYSEVITCARRTYAFLYGSTNIRGWFDDVWRLVTERKIVVYRILLQWQGRTKIDSEMKKTSAGNKYVHKPAVT